MGTLSSELGPIVEQSTNQPRIYADANVPLGAIGYMRRPLGRTLVTLDRDYLDDRQFPPEEGAGVIVFCVPDERWLRRLLSRADRDLFRAGQGRPLPLERRKVEWHIDAQPGS